MLSLQIAQDHWSSEFPAVFPSFWNQIGEVSWLKGLPLLAVLVSRLSNGDRFEAERGSWSVEVQGVRGPGVLGSERSRSCVSQSDGCLMVSAATWHIDSHWGSLGFSGVILKDVLRRMF